MSHRLVHSRIPFLIINKNLERQGLEKALPHLFETHRSSWEPIITDPRTCIEHTMLKPNAVASEFERLCTEAREWKFPFVSVNVSRIGLCAELLKGQSTTGIVANVGFPLGATSSCTKAFEAQAAIKLGAKEIDCVMNIGKFLEGDYKFVQEDIEKVCEAVRAEDPSVKVKVILETGYMTKEQVVDAAVLARLAGAHFLKTSTGFGGITGADAGVVALIREVVGTTMGVKASGGVKTYLQAMDMLAAGADRIGTSSSVTIAHQIPQPQTA